MIARAFLSTALMLTVGATVFLRPLGELNDFAGSQRMILDPSMRGAGDSPSAGLRIQRNTLLILFRKDAPRIQTEKLLLRYKLIPRARMESIPLYVVESPPTKAYEGKAEADRLRKLIAELKSEKNRSLVAEAVQNTYLGPTTVPRFNNNPRITWDWHAPAATNGVEPLRLMHFPQAWNFRGVITNRNQVGMIDIAFDFIARHEDLTFIPFGNKACNPTFGLHGQAVAGIIGATFDNTVGVDGASPFADLVVCVANSGATGTVTDVTSTDPVDAELLDLLNPFSSHLYGLELMLKAGLPIINVSMAYNWYKADLEADTNGDLQRLIEAQGKMVLDLLSQYPNSVIVTAAGNECEDLARLDPTLTQCPLEAKWASPLNWAALGPPAADQAKNVIVVEAAGINRAILPLSNRGGTMMAIGQQVGTTSTGNRYGICKDSTSCAAPFVTGTVSMMLAYNPSLTVAEVRSKLLQSTDGRLLNAFKAVAASSPDAAFDLADFNDDDEVDMEDFEELHDAFHQVTSGTFTDDLNHDGKTDTNELNFPRQDLNGDGQISATATSFFPGIGNVTDLQVMMHVWTDTSVDRNTLPARLLQP
jgi:hypothetical protein